MERPSAFWSRPDRFFFLNSGLKFLRLVNLEWLRNVNGRILASEIVKWSVGQGRVCFYRFQASEKSRNHCEIRHAGEMITKTHLRAIAYSYFTLKYVYCAYMHIFILGKVELLGAGVSSISVHDICVLAHFTSRDPIRFRRTRVAVVAVVMSSHIFSPGRYP